MPINYIEALDELASEISEIAVGKGFWEYDEFSERAVIPTKLALIHSEVSEALDVHREEYDDSPVDSVLDMTDMQEDDFTEELADVVIRAMDIAGYLDLDLGRVLVSKVEKNKARSYRHGKRY